MRATLHIAQHVTDIFEHALHSGLRADDLTTPAAVQAWSEWIPTDEFLAKQAAAKEKTDA